MATFLNLNCSLTAKHVHDERSHENNLNSMCSHKLRYILPSSTSAKAINNSLNKTNTYTN